MVQKTAEPERHFRVLRPEVLSLQGMQKYRPVCTSGKNTGVTGHFQPHVLCVLVAQLCLTLCDPMVCSPPGSSVHGVFQARILQWVTMLTPGDSGIEPGSPALQVDSLPSEPLGSPILE